MNIRYKITIYLTVLCGFSFSSLAQGTNKEALISLKFDDPRWVKDSLERQKIKSATVWKQKETGFIFFKADLDLDADGSPRAYNKANTGILHNDNGRNKDTGKWFAVAKDEKGEPIVQKEGAPYPNYYISTTTLELTAYEKGSVERYVNAETIPYVVLPGKHYKNWGIKLGDIVLVYNTVTQQHCYAIFADTGPAAIIGEASMALAEKIGIRTYLSKSGRIRGGVDGRQIIYVVFPHSAKEHYDTISVEEINLLGEKAAASQGGAEVILTKIKEHYK